MKKKTTPRKKYSRNKKLSDHEIKILTLISRELPPSEISAKMGISEKTFFNHRAHLKWVTGARTNIGLYRYALRKGYVNL